MQTITLFSISPTSGEPVYRQFLAQVQRFVSSGRLQAGDSLPSIREVAKALTVNPMTVSKAYSLLEASGYVERCKGVGMKVLEVADSSPEEHLRTSLRELADKAKQLGLSMRDTRLLLKQNWELNWEHNWEHNWEQQDD